MKNFMRIDTKKRQIIMDKTFYNKSLYFGTEEYDKLQTARKDYPGFTPVRREIRKPDHRRLLFACANNTRHHIFDKGVILMRKKTLAENIYNKWVKQEWA